MRRSTLFFLLGTLCLAVCVTSGQSQTLSDYCCLPAHPDTPTAPPSDCGFDDTLGCYSENDWYPSDAWEDAIPGNCNTKSVGKNCNPNSAQTAVTISKGKWYCTGSTKLECHLGWKLYDPAIQQNISPVSNCTGDSCPP
jgi:hypothetical protein